LKLLTLDSQSLKPLPENFDCRSAVELQILNGHVGHNVVFSFPTIMEREAFIIVGLFCETI